MIVTLDGDKVETSFPTDATLQAIIDQVRAEQPSDRLVVSVAIDGHTCDEDELGAQLGAPLDGATQIDLESADPVTLAADALRTVADRLDTIGAQQPDIARQINAGEVAAAVPRINGFVQTWQTVQLIIEQISRLTGRDLTTENFAGQPIGEHVTALLDQLRNIRDALDAQDMVTLADLMHYEAPTICETWRDLLRYFADELNPQSD